MANETRYQVEVVPVGGVRTREFFDGVLEIARKYSSERISFRDLRLPANQAPARQAVSSAYFVFPDEDKARKFMGELIGNERVDETLIGELNPLEATPLTH
jgi:hypothetical protein